MTQIYQGPHFVGILERPGTNHQPETYERRDLPYAISEKYPGSERTVRTVNGDEDVLGKEIARTFGNSFWYQITFELPEQKKFGTMGTFHPLSPVERQRVEKA